MAETIHLDFFPKRNLANGVLLYFSFISIPRLNSEKYIIGAHNTSAFNK